MIQRFLRFGLRRGGQLCYNRSEAFDDDKEPFHMTDYNRLLRGEPLFWSRLGFCYDPPIRDAAGRPLIMYACLLYTSRCV